MNGQKLNCYCANCYYAIWTNDFKIESINGKRHHVEMKWHVSMSYWMLFFHAHVYAIFFFSISVTSNPPVDYSQKGDLSHAFTLFFVTKPIHTLTHIIIHQRPEFRLNKLKCDVVGLNIEQNTPSPSHTSIKRTMTSIYFVHLYLRCACVRVCMCVWRVEHCLRTEISIDNFVQPNSI